MNQHETCVREYHPVNQAVLTWDATIFLIICILDIQKKNAAIEHIVASESIQTPSLWWGSLEPSGLFQELAV